MSRKLTPSDRKALIRLASKMEKGSEERKAILNGLKGASTKTALSPLWRSTVDQLKAIKMHCDEMIDDIDKGRFGQLVRDMEALKANAKVAEVLLKQDLKDYEKSSS